MYGIDFTGHPNLIHLYLPGAFEGHPLRKDFPLLAREVKPWPGLVDVEAMPGESSSGEAASA
jgi:NADH-quinone oxidoreductase subunit C